MKHGYSCGTKNGRIKTATTVGHCTRGQEACEREQSFAQEKESYDDREVASSAWNSATMRSSNLQRKAEEYSAKGHLLRHLQKQSAILFVRFAQHTPKLAQKSCVFAGATPGNFVRRFPFEQVRQLRWLLAIVEELIEWDFYSACHLLQRFDGRDGMSILDAGNVGAKQAAALFDVPRG